MNELVVNYHDFENAKKEIKKFSEQTTTNIELRRVNTSKSTGEFWKDIFSLRGIGLKHNVTGEELNDLTSQIQRYLKDVNNTQINLIKQFGQVYNALDALDKDYINGIRTSIEEIEETSEAVQHTQEKMKEVVNNQVKTLKELKKFKEKLDGYAHLKDVDKIWSDFQKCNQKIEHLSMDIYTAIEQSRENVKKIDELRTVLDKITHLKDVDSTWDTVNKHSEQLIEIEKQNGYIVNSIQKNREDVEEKISAAIQETNGTIEFLTKKIKYAYWIAGGAAGLAIIELLLLLL